MQRCRGGSRHWNEGLARELRGAARLIASRQRAEPRLSPRAPGLSPPGLARESGGRGGPPGGRVPWRRLGGADGARPGPALLCSGRRFSDTPARAPAPTEAAAASAIRDDVVDDDDDLKVRVVLPYRSAEERDRYEKTNEFIRIVVATAAEQDSKDMIACAVKVGTLRDAHLCAVIHSVQQASFDSPSSSERGSDGDAEAGRVQREGGNDGGEDGDGGSTSSGPSDPHRRAPRCHRGGDRTICTPESRLARAEVVVRTAVEEGYRPEPRTVHLLLEALLNHCAPLHPDQPPTSLPPRPGGVAPERIWAFLAWMETHGYGVVSEKTLERLGAIVEPESPGPRAAIPHAPPVEGSAGPPRSRIAPDVRANRLDYLSEQRRGLRAHNLAAARTPRAPDLSRR